MVALVELLALRQRFQKLHHSRSRQSALVHQLADGYVAVGHLVQHAPVGRAVESCRQVGPSGELVLFHGAIYRGARPHAAVNAG